MWHGPQPQILDELSTVELQVIQLARLFVIVKHISARSSQQSGLPSMRPYYHTGNAVAYPLDAGKLLRKLNRGPESLAPYFNIVFEGSNRDIVRYDA